MGSTIKDMVAALVAGASFSNVMLGVAINVAMDVGAGKLLDEVVAIGKLRNALNWRAATKAKKFSKYRAASAAMYGDLPADWEVHRLFPQAFADKVQGKIVFNDPMWTIGLPQEWHSWITHKFDLNSRWREFFQKCPNASSQQMMEFMGELQEIMTREARDYFGA